MDNMAPFYTSYRHSYRQRSTVNGSLVGYTGDGFAAGLRRFFRTLRRIGLHLFQGYLLARPALEALPEMDFARLATG